MRAAEDETELNGRGAAEFASTTMSDDRLHDRGQQRNAHFHTTHWSVVRHAGESGSEQAKKALTELIKIYWYPLYAFSRRQGSNDHDAMDLTQGFFTHLLSGDALGSVSPDKGKFRSFLLASFKNFMANERRTAGAIRRGGLATVLSLSTTDFQTRYDREPVDRETPELLFERKWVEALLQRVRALLAQDYERAGKTELYTLLEPHLAHHGEALPRAEISSRLKLSMAAVAMSIHRMRRRYGELLREELAATVDNPADVESELKTLLEIASQAERQTSQMF